MYDLNDLKKFDNNGYPAYWIPNHHLAGKTCIVYEHMLVAEELLGRELKIGEEVHHKDKDRYNNSFDNLMVFKTKADHIAFHNGREAIKDGDVYISIRTEKESCPICGKEKDSQAKLCMDCYNKEKAKNIPTKEVLIDKLLNYSVLAIGKMYNVSDNAVRRWCRKYELPYKREDIIEFRKAHAIMQSSVKERH